METIETSNFVAGELLAKHLLELGHKKIAYISTLAKSRDVTPLYERNHLLLEHAIGYELCQECLQDSEITAFVGVNDIVWDYGRHLGCRL